MVNQRKFTPHNQNKNKVEQRIQYVKHKTTLVLQRLLDPLIFWCYTLIFVLDLLNYTAKKPLGYQTFIEVINGDTNDISPFRFKFFNQ